MIGDYLVVALVFGIAGSFVFILHHFWLRDAFKEEAQAKVPAKEEGTCRVSTPNTPPERKSCGLSQTRIPGGYSDGIITEKPTKNQLASGASTGSQVVGGTALSRGRLDLLF